MDPAKGHYRLFNLDFEQFDLVDHAALVLGPCLLWED